VQAHLASPESSAEDPTQTNAPVASNAGLLIKISKSIADEMYPNALELSAELEVRHKMILPRCRA
jgi:hypothetical protein